MGDVKLLSRWDGWCDPCGIERPLLLTAKGEFGPRAWLSGVGMEDRTLVLTCGVCGEWQLCPWDEEFPKEAVLFVEAGPEPVQSTEATVISEAVTKRGIFSRKPAVVAQEAEEVVAEPTIVELPPVTAVEPAATAEVEVGTPKRGRLFSRQAAEIEVEVVDLAPEVAEDEAPAPARFRVEAEVPKIVDAELLRSIARAEARAQQVAAALAAAAAEAHVEAAVEAAVRIEAETDEAPAPDKRRRFGKRARTEDAVEAPQVVEEPAAPVRPKRRTAPVQHIVLQTAYGPARATAVPALPAPRFATPNEQDASLHLLTEGLDLITTAGR